MNKLYILGALALANVEAAVGILASGTSIYVITQTLPAFGVAGAYTYTTTGDCYSAGTATSLGMNNIYHQYYSFALTKGTATFATVSITVPAIINTAQITISITAAYGGCYHSHLYNWMAQPQLAITTQYGGYGNSVVAYGYAMSGTAVTSCTSATIVTTTLFKANIFTGSQYQSSALSYNPSAGTITNAQIVPVWGKVGPGLYVAKATTAVATWATIISAALWTTTAQNSYWDFMQTNIFMGQTQFGRGGGASTAPCGWWVVYSYEYPKAGQVGDIDTINQLDDGSIPTVNMWTDNSIVNAASAFVLTALAGLLF